MNIKINYQKMDGKTCGFGAVYFPQNSKNEEFIRDKDGNIKLFKNMGLLKSWMNNVVHENNPFMYEIFIKPKFEDFLIPFDEVQFLNGVYEWYSDDGMLFMFKESKVVKTLDLGYFVFEKNPNKEISKEEGKEKATDDDGGRGVRFRGNEAAVHRVEDQTRVDHEQNAHDRWGGERRDLCMSSLSPIPHSFSPCSPPHPGRHSEDTP